MENPQGVCARRGRARARRRRARSEGRRSRSTHRRRAFACAWCSAMTRDQPARRQAGAAGDAARCREARDRVLHRYARSDRAGAARRVRHFGPSRLVVRPHVQRMAHPRDHAGDLPLPPRSRESTGRSSSGLDTHALSVPACATALEVLAANGVEVMLAERRRIHADARVSHAILTYNRGRTRGTRRRHRDHAVAQSARRRRLQVQPAERRAGRHRRHRLDRSARQRAARTSGSRA